MEKIHESLDENSHRGVGSIVGLVAQLCNRKAAIIIRIFGKYIYLMNAFYFYLYIVLCDLKKKDSYFVSEK